MYLYVRVRVCVYVSDANRTFYVFFPSSFCCTFVFLSFISNDKGDDWKKKRKKETKTHKKNVDFSLVFNMLHTITWLKKEQRQTYRFRQMMEKRKKCINVNYYIRWWKMYRLLKLNQYNFYVCTFVPLGKKKYEHENMRSLLNDHQQLFYSLILFLMSCPKIQGYYCHTYKYVCQIANLIVWEKIIAEYSSIIDVNTISTFVRFCHFIHVYV